MRYNVARIRYFSIRPHPKMTKRNKPTGGLIRGCTVSVYSRYLLILTILILKRNLILLMVLKKFVSALREGQDVSTKSPNLSSFLLYFKAV